MVTWTSKHWGALIGALVLFAMFEIGFEETIIVVLFGILGYFIGKFLDGEFDIADIRARDPGRRRG